MPAESARSGRGRSRWRPFGRRSSQRAADRLSSREMPRMGGGSAALSSSPSSELLGDARVVGEGASHPDDVEPSRLDRLAP